MKFNFIFLLSLLFIYQTSQGQTENDIWTFKSSELSPPETPYVWESNTPESYSAKISKTIPAISFTGRFANYTKADTWYPTWASDGNLYSPWTDGTIGSDMKFVWSGADAKSRRGHAKIVGDDPMDLTVEDFKIFGSSALPYQGRYPCGSLFYNGVWYYGSYTIDQPTVSIRKKFGWYVQGPLVGFRYSKDYGKTWTESPHTPAEPLFPEVSRDRLDLKEGKKGPFIKMGAPHFVDFGKNMEHSPDGKAYLVGHGSPDHDELPRIANTSWNSGDAIYMARVKPSIKNINKASKYQYFCGYNKRGKAKWSRKFSKIKPIFEWNNHCGIVTITYNEPLKKYFMCVTNGNKNNSSRKKYDSYILESDNVTGPWEMVTYMEDFGPQAYFLNIPSKFISKDGKTAWLAYSANYMLEKKRNNKDHLKKTKPTGSAYSLSLQEIKFHTKD